MSVLNQLPEAKKVKGLVLRPSTGQSGPDRIFLQYEDKADEWHELSISVSDGLFLLELLQQMKSDLRKDAIKKQ